MRHGLRGTHASGGRFVLDTGFHFIISDSAGNLHFSINFIDHTSINLSILLIISVKKS